MSTVDKRTYLINWFLNSSTLIKSSSWGYSHLLPNKGSHNPYDFSIVKITVILFKRSQSMISTCRFHDDCIITNRGFQRLNCTRGDNLFRWCSLSERIVIYSTNSSVHLLEYVWHWFSGPTTQSVSGVCVEIFLLGWLYNNGIGIYR